MSLLCLFTTKFSNTLLPNDKVQAIPADIGKIIKPKPVTVKISKLTLLR